jgi:hypothetical protein
VRRIEDYKLEELLREPEAYLKRCGRGMTRRDLNWRHLAQHAVGHTLNDYFSQPPEARAGAAVEPLFAARWRGTSGKFAALEREPAVYQTVLAGLVRLLEERRSERPTLLFEAFQTQVAALGIELSLIIQTLVQQPDGGYRIDKILVDDDPEVIRASLHLTTAFCAAAFGVLPTSIRIDCLLSGSRYESRPTAEEVRQAHDYLRLIASLGEDEAAVCRSMAASGRRPALSLAN